MVNSQNAYRVRRFVLANAATIGIIDMFISAAPYPHGANLVAISHRSGRDNFETPPELDADFHGDEDRHIIPASYVTRFRLRGEIHGRTYGEWGEG